MDFRGCLLKVDLPTFRRVLKKNTPTTTVQQNCENNAVPLSRLAIEVWSSNLLTHDPAYCRFLQPILEDTVS
jgi:hypothetical protein